jgi:hypothetical protein
MKLGFKYDIGQGSKEITISPRAIIGYERENRTKISRLVEGIGVSDMADLVWRQVKIDGTFSGTFDEFIDALLEVDPDFTPDPTSPDPEV